MLDSTPTARKVAFVSLGSSISHRTFVDDLAPDFSVRAFREMYAMNQLIQIP
jgi:hypothetical protein